MRVTDLLTVLLCLLTQSLTAKVLYITVDHRDTILNGRNWGEAGAYELLKGKVFFGTDPLLRQNQAICDITFGPKDENGLVLSSADLVVLKPIDPSKSKIALVEVSNRGSKFTPSYFLNGSGRVFDANNPLIFGDGMLLKRGITMIWVGWQFDLPLSEDLLNFNTPVAKFPEGTPITGLVRSDWTVDEKTYTLGLGHRDQIGYPVYDKSSDLHVLTKRSGRNGMRTVVDRNQWNFGRLESGTVIDDAQSIYSEAGFQAGMIYELVYYAANPSIVGLGLTALRDIISYAKYDKACIFPVDFGVAAGVSQTGRFLRQFNYQGFNQDEAGRIAFDGNLIITAGGGRGSFNHRFAQPSRDAHRYSAFFYPTDIFPFSSTTQRDPVTQIEDGILNHLAENYRPKIFSVNTGYEYWGRSASLIHTDPLGQKDVVPMDNERIYHIASGQHYVDAFPPSQDGLIRYIGNPLEFRPNYRALLIDLMDWVVLDREPPVSTIPRISEGTLVHTKDVHYPNLPDFQPAKHTQEAYRVDYGPSWNQGIISYQPPIIGEAFINLVPQVDTLGNEISGIRNAEIAVPLATYIPYSLRENLAGGNGEMADFRGTFIPLSVHQVSNQDDNRPNIATLYSNKQAYLNKVQQHLWGLIRNRFLLKEDMHRILMRSSKYWNWITKPRSNKSQQINMMSFNIRYDNPGDGVSRWDNRKAMVAQEIMAESPDFFGLQEALEHQCEDVARLTKSYRWIGVGREDGKKQGEYAPIFYNRKTWKLLTWNTLWLSETPEIPSKGWDAAFERIVTYAKFEHKTSGKIVYVFNTHFDHRGVQARINSAKLIRQKIIEIVKDDYFILSGDFNVSPETEAYQTLINPEDSNPIIDTKLLSLNDPVGPSGTFSGFKVTDYLPQDQIDYIFCSKNFDVSDFKVIVHSEEGLYASDHFAVSAQLRY